MKHLQLIRKIKLLKELFVTEKNKFKNSDDLSLRITQLRISIIDYEKDINVIRDRITEFEGLRNIIKLKIRSNEQDFNLMEDNRVRCYFSKIDVHRASYSRHLKSKKHIENEQQNKVFIPRKNPMKRVVKKKKIRYLILIQNLKTNIFLLIK